MRNKEQDQKYNESNPRVSVRLSPDQKADLLQKASKAGCTLTDLVTLRMDTTRIKQDFAFLFKFFQKNAPKLDINDEERDALKTIMKRAGQL